MPKGFSGFLELEAPLPTGRRSALASFLSQDSKTDWFKDLDRWSPWTWRKQHNYFLDRGVKFMVVYKTPSIVGTNIFDLEKFGCFQVRGYQGGSGLSYLSKAASSALGARHEKVKDWWIHPRIEFSAPVSRVAVRLQDMTTGELRWDAIYDLGKASWKQRAEEKSCPENGWHLCEDEEPVGGEKPFFQPDWCPGPNDGVSHKYLLTVKNLSQRDSPEQPLVGEMLFTQYGINQLDNTYSFEMHAPLSAEDQNKFNQIQGLRKADALSRATGRGGSPEGMAMEAARGKIPDKTDLLKKATPLKPQGSVADMAKGQMGDSVYSKMLDNSQFAKTL